MEQKSNGCLPCLSLWGTLVMICVIKKAAASTFMAETKFNLNKKPTEPSEDAWQPARGRTASEGWAKRLLQMKGPQEVDTSQPVTSQPYPFLNEWRSNNQRMDKRLVKRAISQPPLVFTTPEPPRPPSRDFYMTVAESYAVPDTFKVGDTYLFLQISTQKTCMQSDNPRNTCLEIVSPAGLEDLEVSVKFTVGEHYRRDLDACRKTMSKLNCSTGSLKKLRFNTASEFVFERSNTVILFNALNHDNTGVKCGLAHRVHSPTLSEIYAAQEHCPLTVTHECRITITVSNSDGLQTYDTRLELIDENELPNCSSPFIIPKASTWSVAKCFDRDDYLMTTCGAPGCLSYGRNSYQPLLRPPGTMMKQASGDGLNITVDPTTKPFKMTLAVTPHGQDALRRELDVFYDPEPPVSEDPCDLNGDCGSGFDCDDHLCACPSNQYWDEFSSTCKIKKKFNDPCTSSIQCWSDLICTTDKCLCKTSQFWNTVDSTCEFKKTFHERCGSDNECGSNLRCLTDKCGCEDNQHWNDSTCETTQYKTIVRYEGWTVLFHCPVERDAWSQNTEVTWYRHDGTFIGNGPVLHLKYLRADDTGIYICKTGGNISGTFNIHVYWRDQIESPMRFANFTIPYEFSVRPNEQSPTRNDLKFVEIYLGEYLRRSILAKFPNVYSIIFQNVKVQQRNHSSEDTDLHYYECELKVSEIYDDTVANHIDDIKRRINDNQQLVAGPLSSILTVVPEFNSGQFEGMEGEKLRINFSFYILCGYDKPTYQLLWQFGNQFLNATAYRAGALVSMKVHTSEYYSPVMQQTLLTVVASLDIDNLKSAFAGEYRCHLLLDIPSGQEIATVSKFISKIYPRPGLIMSPLSTVTVAYNSTVTYSCHFRNVTELRIVVNGRIQSQMSDMYADSFKISSSITTGSNRTEDVVLCYAKGMIGLTTVRKELVIRSLPKDDATPMCEASYDRRDTFWIAAPQNASPIDACPENYVGIVTRTCSVNGTWLPSNYSACKRKDLAAVEDKVEVLKLLEKPSPKEVESITSDLAQSVITSPQPVYGNDIHQVVDILSQLGNVVSEKEKDDGKETTALLSDSALVDVASLTDKLMTANQSDWKEANIDDVGREADKSGKVKATEAPAGRLMLAMEQLVSSTLNDSKMTSQTIVKKNLVIKRAKVSSSDDIRFPKSDEKAYQEYDGWVTQSQSTAFLPHEALSRNGDDVRYAVLLYRGIDEKLQAPQRKTYAQSVCDPSPDDLLGKQVMTDVLSFSLNTKAEVLSPPLDLAFPVPENASGPVCGFLDTSTGSWSADGCETMILEDGLVECHCDHLTNFAVLMSPAGTDIASIHHQILSIVTIIGCSISITCLLITILAYALFWRFTKNDLSVLHLNLSVCLIVSYIVFMAGINEICRATLCTFIAALLHYVLLVVFFLMLSEGVEITLSVSVIFSRKSALPKLLVASYGIPAILVAISLAATHTEGYRSEQYCWLSVETGTLWAFVGPALFVILANSVLAVIVLKAMATTTSMRKQEEAQKAKKMTKALLALTSLLGIGWVFGILAVNSETIVFQYLFALFNSLQGLSIFIFHCLLSRQVRNGFSTLYRRLSSRRDDYSKTKSGSGPPAHNTEQKEMGSMKEDSMK